ncbi:MAG: hypothetical protein M3540_00395 [Actinomycetota bacterium]|nr:hypothetical protein [Actinomycetota bacterium]
MKVAFHFDADAHGLYYGPPIKELVFRALTKVPPDERDMRLDCGDLLVWGQRPDLVLGKLFATQNWTTCGAPFAEATANRCVYVVAVEDLAGASAEAVDAALGEDSSFLGSLEVLRGNPLHAVLYHQSLIPMFRIVGDELRVFYEQSAYEAGAADRDEVMFEHWRSLQIFERVAWEDARRALEPGGEQ